MVGIICPPLVGLGLTELPHSGGADPPLATPLFFAEAIIADDIFDTGAYGVASKSQNPIVLGQGGPSSTQCSNHSWACSCNFFTHTTKTSQKSSKWS